MGLFGGSKSSSASSNATGRLNFNSSGWVVGGGSANGGGITSKQSAGLPWYAILSIASVGYSYIYYRKKRGR